MVVYVASAAFLLGVALASLLPLNNSFVYALLLMAASVLLLYPFIKKRAVFIFGLVLLLCACGVFRMVNMPLLEHPVLNERLGERVVFEGIISDDVDARETSTLLTVSLLNIEDAPNLLVRAPEYTEVSYGDLIKVSGLLELPEPFETDTGRVFDYRGYLAVSNVGYIVQEAAVEVKSSGHGNSFLATLFYIKHSYLTGLGAALPSPHAALAGGITAGDKRSLGKDLLDEFRDTGIIHIVVLSGYNVTIIAETLLKMLAFLPLRASLAVGAFGIVAFALATGAGASIVRASTMAILALLARALNRSYAINRALVLAVVGMVAWNPYIFLFDVGFQLSVLATVGLVYVSPLIENRFSWLPENLGLRTVVGATLGTQLTVLPLLLWQMGTFSVVALPVNILVLVVIPLAMLLSFIAAVFGVFIPALSIFVGVPAYALLSYVLNVVHVAASLPFAAVTIEPFSVWIMILSYTILFAWLWWVYRSKENVDAYGQGSSSKSLF